MVRFDRNGNLVYDFFTGYLEVESDTAGYTGLMDNEGNWVIIKETVSGTVTSSRYVKGKDGFEASWTNRVNLTYGYTV